jgi:hypothetical protein
MTITDTTPPNWLLSNTILLYNKIDPYTLQNYRPITLANVLNKLWASCLAILAMDYIEASKIIRPEQGGFRPELYKMAFFVPFNTWKMGFGKRRNGKWGWEYIGGMGAFELEMHGIVGVL